MPGKSVEKYVVTGTGKLAGKTHVWIAGVFVNVKEAKPWVALLNVAHKTADVETIKKMDKHAPVTEDGKTPESVKYSGAIVQYSPEIPGLEDDATLG